MTCAGKFGNADVARSDSPVAAPFVRLHFPASQQLIQRAPQAFNSCPQLHTLLFRDVRGMLWVGHKPNQCSVAGFGSCQRLFGMQFTPFLFSLCNAGKCETSFQLRPQKLDPVPVGFSLKPHRFR